LFNDVITKFDRDRVFFKLNYTWFDGQLFGKFDYDTCLLYVACYYSAVPDAFDGRQQFVQLCRQIFRRRHVDFVDSSVTEFQSDPMVRARRLQKMRRRREFTVAFAKINHNLMVLIDRDLFDWQRPAQRSRALPAPGEKRQAQRR
jgi:hypothetical protein